MKKFTLLTFLFLISMTYGFAQNPIPNPSFETWRNYPITNGVMCTTCTGTVPDSWQLSDSAGMLALCGSAHNAVQELVNKCGGNYSVKLTTWTCTFLSITVPGTATNGRIDIVGAGIAISGGSPDIVRHANFTGCYKYTPSGSDTAIISAYLFRRNGAVRETLAVAAFTPSVATASMTAFTVPFNYQSTATPDSILIICGSSLGVGGSAVAGSTLYIDTLGVSGIATYIGENGGLRDIKVYPQPARDVLNIDASLGHVNNGTYTLIDDLGRVVIKGELKEKQAVNIAPLANGIYTVVLNDASGERLYSARVTVRH